MKLVTAICVLFICTQISITVSDTDTQDVVGLTALKALWKNVPPSWNGFPDPCGRGWEGIICNGSRVIAITLASMNLEGTLSGDIQELSELQILDLSYNRGLSGPLPSAIGNLAKLTNLVLVGCNFNGQLPDSIGSLSQLRFLYLNSNSFTGRIPNSFGNLSMLYWLDLGENKLTGTLPVSNGNTSGLDMLVWTKHFHLGRNQFSGSVPSQLLHKNMTMIHLLLDNNQLTGNVPSTLGLVQTLEVVRLDWNSINGSIPSSISNLTSVTDLLLSNNRLTGIMPNLTGMNQLSYLDMSNNSFEASDFPSWFAVLPSLTDLIMEGIQIDGSVPETLFSLPHLQQVVLRKNGLDGRLDIGAARSPELRIVELQNNNISAYTHRPGNENLELSLDENPVCQDTTVGLESYCGFSQVSKPSYVTPQDCVPVTCSSDELSSPNCECGYPYSGTFVFRAPHFTNLQNFTYYAALEQKLMTRFGSFELPVDSVSLSNISRFAENYLEIALQIFPRGQTRFNRTAISWLGFMLSNQTFKPPPVFGTFYFTANEYRIFADEPGSRQTLGMAAIIGIAVGGSVLLLTLLCVGFIIFCRKKRTKKPVEPTYPLVHTSASPWTSPGSDPTSTLQLPGSRLFSLEEVKKITNNFSEANDIGSGAFGKVYRGVLANGHLVAVKRADQELSRHCGTQFKNEIELLTRVHHRNLVKMLGFCLEKGELILLYEYVPNGTLKESLSGKSGIRLDWWRRIKIALGAARGLAYLHELASPPIIHRDIKSNNILLDENLDAKVSDFGVSKPMSDIGKGHITTEVKGTMGYLDPEYYLTQKLNEKSDVYSFGVLMLELVTGKSPLVRGKYIVREVKNGIDRAQDMYGLHGIVDQGIGLDTSVKGIEKYVDLALACVEKSGAKRPSMGEAVKELENIVNIAGLNPLSDSGRSSSTTYYPRNFRHLYGDESLYSHHATLPR